MRFALVIILLTGQTEPTVIDMATEKTCETAKQRFLEDLAQQQPPIRAVVSCLDRGPRA
jgi:hypothetical protein